MKNLVNHGEGKSDFAIAVTDDSASAGNGIVSVEFGSSSAPRTVLLVEDDSIIVDLLQNVLQNAGFGVRIARHAAEALELFSQFREETCCVILDYGIPGMHASRLLERFLELDPEVKVILSSGYPQNFIVEDFPLERISGFLAKPYDPQVLVFELRRLVTEQSVAASMR